MISKYKQIMMNTTCKTKHNDVRFISLRRKPYGLTTPYTFLSLQTNLHGMKWTISIQAPVPNT